MKCAGAREKRNERARGTLGRGKKGRFPSSPARPRFFNLPFLLSFFRFLAVSPLKEPLRRRESETRSTPRAN